MKVKSVVILVFIIICCSFYACSKDDDGGYSRLDNQENVIEYKVYSNFPGAQITLSNINGTPLIIKGYWETKIVTKDYFAQFIARCDEETALISGEIYVNGKLKLKREANRYLNLTIRIK